MRVRRTSAPDAPRILTDAGRSPPATYTGPVEDYLKVIYELERAAGSASTSDIAHQLAIAPASVTGMIRRLADQELLEYEPYRGVRLTETGQRVALRTIRRHRIIETFLVRVLGYSWDEVHDQAERLEHAATEELIERMAATLHDPQVDPHGAPIPTRDGEIDEMWYSSIADLAPGTRARVTRVGDDDPARLRYLAELGLVPGAQVQVVDRAPYDGPITVRVGVGSRALDHAVGPALASGVLVELAKKREMR